MKNKKFLLAAIICVIGISTVSQLWLSIRVHPEDQIQQKDPSPAEPQIGYYFGNLTGAEWNSEGQIIKLKFEDGTAFTVDHYVRLSGWNRYYNVTYQPPDQLLSIQEYVKGSFFE